MKNKIGILGAGAWGTALGKVISEKGLEVQLWSYEAEVCRDINENSTNSRYLEGVGLPAGLNATTDLREAATDKEFIILASPSMYLLSTVKSILSVPNIMEGKSVMAVITKGFITTDLGPRLIVPTLEDYLPGFYKGNLVYVSGPSHAEEVGRGKLTGLISASNNPKNSIRVRELLSCPALIVFSSLDSIGVQVCAAVKNVIAIAFGMLDALKDLSTFVGDNTESLLLAAGLSEIQVLGRALGATHPETFTSIAGVGDLDVTCRSPYGRNRRFGREVVLSKLPSKYGGIDELLADIKNLGYLPEGAFAARATNALMTGRQLRLPICDMVYRILNREVEPMSAIETLIRGLTKMSLETLLSSQEAEV